jgi:hypothetical protein
VPSAIGLCSLCCSRLRLFSGHNRVSLEVRQCDLTVSVTLAITSLTNYAHIALFGPFFVITIAQFRMKTASAFAWTAMATMIMGAIVEREQGLTGRGHCRLRDLLPDAAGVLLAAALIFTWSKVREARRDA